MFGLRFKYSLFYNDDLLYLSSNLINNSFSYTQTFNISFILVKLVHSTQKIVLIYHTI